MAKAMGVYPPPHLATMASRMKPNPCAAPSVVHALYREDEGVILCTWHVRAGTRPVLRTDRRAFKTEELAIDAVEMQPSLATGQRFDRFDMDPPPVLCSWMG